MPTYPATAEGRNRISRAAGRFPVLPGRVTAPTPAARLLDKTDPIISRGKQHIYSAKPRNYEGSATL